MRRLLIGHVSVERVLQGLKIILPMPAECRLARMTRLSTAPASIEFVGGPTVAKPKSWVNLEAGTYVVKMPKVVPNKSFLLAFQWGGNQGGSLKLEASGSAVDLVPHRNAQLVQPVAPAETAKAAEVLDCLGIEEPGGRRYPAKRRKIPERPTHQLAELVEVS